ncbi:uncharacterized protein EI90DRAFT_2496628 [Cantharellus anzutake]|uniref:uncharacterized protein n=1 Tax=Cantharellus anzutake TaxID=1750568 RepID=UPI00190535C9|nr:uncharacterized protein EI90DRAFT_2496628 [Cantharellus anzutake]KAF8321831.1 hypothetical protein EI90DRAFT_2496628 [Cantharellus anzutake]
MRHGRIGNVKWSRVKHLGSAAKLFRTTNAVLLMVGRWAGKCKHLGIVRVEENPSLGSISSNNGIHFPNPSDQRIPVVTRSFAIIGNVHRVTGETYFSARNGNFWARILGSVSPPLVSMGKHLERTAKDILVFMPSKINPLSYAWNMPVTNINYGLSQFQEADRR